MAGFLKKVVGFFTAREDFEPDYDEFDEEEYEEAYDVADDYADDEPTIRIVPREEQTEESVLVEKPMRSQCKHVDYTPYSFDDMANVVDVLNAGKAVVLHLAELDADFRQRVIDFMCGAVYSLGCMCDMPTDEVCIIIPENADAFGI